MGEMEIRYYIGDPNPHTLLTLLEGLTNANHRWWMRERGAGREPLSLYESDCRYIREGVPELWFDYPAMRRRTDPGPGDDCDGLGCARAGELRAEGYDAHPVLRWYDRGDGTGGVYHNLTEIRTDGDWWYDDPSARLGMLGDRPRVAGPGYTPDVPVTLYKPFHQRALTRPRTGLVRLADDVPEAAPRPLPLTMRLIRFYRMAHDPHAWLTHPSPGRIIDTDTAVVCGPMSGTTTMRVASDLLSTLYFLPVRHASGSDSYDR